MRKILKMNIEPNKVVQIHYTLANDNNEVMDSSREREPLAYIHGIGQLVPGLENELNGKKAGESFKAAIKPEDAYGMQDDNLIAKVAKSGFTGGSNELEVGMQVQVETQEGAKIAHVAAIEGEEVTLDLNHPLAGMTLHFDVEVMDVREATAEELEHGHVHGADGHHHDH